MLIPLEWVEEFVAIEETPEALADRLTNTGNEIVEVRSSPGGPVFYLKLTPNRPDMLSIRGAAREIAALYGRELRDGAASLEASGPAEPDVRVEVDAADLCPRYAARVIRNVRVGPSPDWLRRRLEAVGLRSISSVVDVTNYVMFEMGQPLHAFDLDLLGEHRILVRRARDREKITLIDGTEVKLDPEMLVIADGLKPVAVAGVMGGRATEVTGGTTNVLLESAYFEPVSVRRTAKRIGAASAASYRFERGVDPEGVLAAADRAAQLIAELSGASVSCTVFDVYPKRAAARRVRFRPERCRALLGTDISDNEAVAQLERLGMQVDRGDPAGWAVTAPTFRPDLAIEEDIIEEVGRMHGYDRIPETLPSGAAAAGKRSPHEELVRAVREHLLAQGLYEAVTNTLTSSAALSSLGLEASPIWPAASGAPVRLRNPLSEEWDTLRPSLLPGLLAAAQHNIRHGTRDVFLFECGCAHARVQEGEPLSRLLIAGLLLGSRWSDVWNADRAQAADFYAAKGVVEALACALGRGSLAADRAQHPAFHPGRTACISEDGERVGIVGELHPSAAERLDLPRGVYLFELDGDALLSRAGDNRKYRPPSRYPRALRDLAIVVDSAVPSAGIERLLRQEMGPWGRVVRLFDVYSGKSLPDGKVSLAYALELEADDRTLTDEEVDARLAAARERLRVELGAEIRGG